MAERNELLVSIAETTVDYRQGAIESPTPEHVDRWVRQFDDCVQLPILQEMDHVLKKTYFSRERTKRFLRGLFETKKLVGDDPCAFWKSVKFLDIQGGGASQTEMLALFSEILEKGCGFQVDDCGAEADTFVYLDDGVFTGNRVRSDFEAWISKEALMKADVHIITIAIHSGGQYYANDMIERAVKSIGRENDIHFHWWSAIAPEDRKLYTDTSDVLRPTEIPDDDEVRAYVEAMNHEPHLRNPGNIGGKEFFSSDVKRQILEQEFLKAGVKIRNLCPRIGDTQRPLGHMTLETLGFGSLIVTFRNCPNNAPLALWAGDPWYPLFCRKPNSEISQREEGF